MDNNRINNIQSFYKQRIDQKGCTYETVWGDDETWKADARFRIIMECDLVAGDIVVDLGAGLGALYKYLKQFNTKISYKAVDASEDFLSNIQKLYPDVNTYHCDFFGDADKLPQADYYTVFGSVNKNWLIGLEGDLSPLYKWLQFLYEKSGKGLYLNGFTANVDIEKEGNIHIDPFKVVELLQGNGRRNFRIEHTAPQFEFSLAVFK